MEKLSDKINYSTKWTINRFKNDDDFKKNLPYSVSEIKGNLLLNEGITALLNLLSGAAEDAFNNTNANIGVGDSTTEAAATQTGLQAVTNKLYKGMETGYPSISGQAITFRSVFGSTEGNFAWQEFTAASGTSDSADNLNRRVDDQGTKAAGQTWTIDLEITFS